MKKISRDKLGTSVLDNIISKYHGSPGGVLGIIEEAQESNKHKYLPEETLEYIAKKSGVSLVQIYSVATFYSFFNLKPQGKHTIVVCRGTACHTRGSKGLLKSLKTLLGIEEDAYAQEEESIPITTKDNKFTIRTVACLGQCALAPAVVIDGKIYGHMTREKLRKVINSISRKKTRR